GGVGGVEVVHIPAADLCAAVGLELRDLLYARASGEGYSDHHLLVVGLGHGPQRQRAQRRVNGVYADVGCAPDEHVRAVHAVVARFAGQSELRIDEGAVLTGAGQVGQLDKLVVADDLGADHLLVGEDERPGDVHDAPGALAGVEADGETDRAVRVNSPDVRSEERRVGEDGRDGRRTWRCDT